MQTNNINKGVTDGDVNQVTVCTRPHGPEAAVRQANQDLIRQKYEKTCMTGWSLSPWFVVVVCC